MHQRELQVADAAADLAVLRVASALPECPGHLVLVCNQCGDSTSALAAQALLTGPYERQTDAPTTMLEVNGQPIHVSPPAVPCSDQHAHDRTVGVGNEQTPRGLREQPLHIVESISGARVLTPSLLPQLQDG